MSAPDLAKAVSVLDDLSQPYSFVTVNRKRVAGVLVDMFSAADMALRATSSRDVDVAMISHGASTLTCINHSEVIAKMIREADKNG
jgi:hypothetical protein